MALTNGFQLPFGIQPLNPVPTDAWSGPYEGVDEATAKNQANSSIPSGVRFKSLEVRLIINGTPKKYWYKNGILNSDLIEYTVDATNSFLTTNYLPLSGGTVTGELNVTNKIYGTIIDWMTLTRGYKISPTSLGSTTESGDAGEVYEYTYDSSPSDVIYYRFISTDGSRDEYYENFSGGVLSNLLAKKQITL